ncbi:hypothetical protein EYC79_01375 [Agrobacterium cavarae]|uniref:Uncharacterized protein n=1 Tax=Agrobacterium cavarae TaxID=2528239 RepID=A0ABY1YDK9_9HYPH|nr:hypothetical protein [Agrobacterium cavarae]TBN19391.1 hypothetical protein EYC79_01375 [Agrobacterium cavarae]
MAIFNKLDRLASKQCDRMYSVSAVIDGVVSTPNGRSQPDPDRREIHIRGIFDEAPAYAAVEQGKRDRSGNDLATLIHGADFVFSVDVLRYPAAASVKQNDHVGRCPPL